MARVSLGHGASAVVDDEDLRLVSPFPWHLLRSPRPERSYARGWVLEGGSRNKVLMHRFILGITGGLDVDHINGDGLDNRRENLRVCTRAENNANQRPVYKHGGDAKRQSRYRGVCWQEDAHKWRARIKVDGRCIHLGLFCSEDEAARTYDVAAASAWGAFATTNAQAKAAGLL